MNITKHNFSNQNIVVVQPASTISETEGIHSTKKMRVAAYCRVSTDDMSQQTSYAMQKDYYYRLITNHAGWDFAGIFADEALSGTSTEHRTEFNRMIFMANEGELDYIVTKSISRFARNTVDTLRIIRQLRSQAPPVGVYFEKENLDTMDSKTELILTIMSAIAQEESRSISENIRWSIRKYFEQGVSLYSPDRMLGYCSVQGEWQPVEEQAAIVRHIFDLYVNGNSAHGISQLLNMEGCRTAAGNRFRTDAVLTILRNEKYNGDVMLQKTVTESYLTHRSVVNNGIAPRYYVRNHHVPLVDADTWQLVQNILAIKAEQRSRFGKSGRGRTVGNIGFCYFQDGSGETVALERCSYRFPDAAGNMHSAPVWKVPKHSQNAFAMEYVREADLIHAYEKVLNACRSDFSSVPECENSRERELFIQCLQDGEGFTWKQYLPFVRYCTLYYENNCMAVRFTMNFNADLTGCF